MQSSPSPDGSGRSGTYSRRIWQGAGRKRTRRTHSKAHSWDLSGFLQVVTLLVILKEAKNQLEHFA